MKKQLLIAVLLASFLPAFSQDNFFENTSWREKTNGPCATDHRCNYYKMVTWDDSQYKQVAYVSGNTGIGPTFYSTSHPFMNFRVIYPAGYDPLGSIEYPVIVMLHGAGESGRAWTGGFNYQPTDNRYDNNSNNLKWGGTEHRDAVNRPANNSRAFPGIVIFPQNGFSANWQTGYNSGTLYQFGNAMVVKFVEWMIANKKADKHRIYIHGLSNGAKGVWDIATKRPDLFAAILPMSGVPASDGKTAAVDSTYTLPIWLFQGGLDTNPSPGAAFEMQSLIKTKGGSLRYTLYPNLGHGTWTTAYAEPDFFSWILDKSRKKIFVPGGTTAICGGGSLKLLFSGYKLQWQLNGVDIPGATGKSYSATTAGVYTVTFKRRAPDNTVYTSDPLTITTGVTSYTPVITNTGSVILPLTKNDGTTITGAPDNGVKLFGPDGFSSYQWYKNGSLVATTTAANYPELNDGSTASYLTTGHGSGNSTPPSAVGDYKLKVIEPSGCLSFESNVITLAFNTNGYINNGHVNPSAAPGTPTFPAATSNSISLSWVDNSSDESYFEIWRTRTSIAPPPTFPASDLPYTQQLYKLVAKVPAGTTSYVDVNGLRPKAQYRYYVRAVGINPTPTDGKFSSPESSTKRTTSETVAPSIPTDLVVTDITDTSIKLQWSAATDNDAVWAYDVLKGSTIVATLKGLNYISGAYSPTNGCYLNGWSGGSYQAGDSVSYNSKVYRATIANSNKQPDINVPTYWTVIDSDLTDGTPAPRTIYRITGLQPGTTYSLSVRAVDYSQNKSALTQPLTVTTTNTSGTIVNFYSKPGVDLSLLSSWSQTTNGSGPSPGDFGDPFQFFYVQSSASTLSNYLQVAGTSSRIIVNNGATLTVDTNGQLDANIYALANSTINVSSSTAPNFISLDPTSTVNLFTGNTIPAASYGNLNLKSPGTITLPVGSTIVAGNLTVDTGITLEGTTGNQSSLTIGGNLTFSNGTATITSTATSQFGVFFSGVDPNKTHTVYIDNKDLNFFSFKTDFADIVNLNFNTASARTLNVGTSGNPGSEMRLSVESTLVMGQNNLVVYTTGGFNPDADGGEVSFNGGSFTLNTTAQKTSSLFFTQGQSTIKDLSITVATQANILNEASIQNLVSLSGQLYITDNVKLLSNATNTARIGPLLNGSAVAGNINFQRYMTPKGRIYRYISSPIATMNVADIQNSGIPVTGTFTGNSNSLVGGAGAASMFGYNAATQAYVAFPPVSNQDVLVKGKGYALFMRSDVYPSATWQSTGDVNQGNVTFTPLGGGTGSASDGWNMLGNPYPAPIKWTGASSGGWSLTNINPIVSVRENLTSTSFTWRTWNGTTGNLPGGFIEQGQAFWVQATNGSPALSVTETAKQITDGTLYREASPYTNALEITLAQGTSIDQTYLQLRENGSGLFNKAEDGYKQMNSAFSLFSKSDDGIPLAINVFEDTYCTKNIPLAFNNIAVGSYSLSFAGFDTFYQGLSGKLKDNFLNTESELNATLVYPFDVTSDVASKAATRFVISLVRTPVLTNLSLTASPTCEQNASVIVGSPQAGMKYQAFYNGQPVSDMLSANNDHLTLVLNTQVLGIGKHSVSVKATSSCGDQYNLEQLATVTIDALDVPLLTNQSGVLTSSITDAGSYEWYLNDELIAGANESSYAAEVSGYYSVKATSKSCAKTSSAFDFTALRVDQALTASEPACETAPTVTITNPQFGAQYQAFVGTTAVSDKIASSPESETSDTLLPLLLKFNLLGSGASTVQIKATYKDGQSKFLTSTSQVSIDALATPKIEQLSHDLVSTIKNADHYQWFLEGTVISGETKATFTPTITGHYTVEVTSKSCVKTSPAFEFTVEKSVPVLLTDLTVKAPIAICEKDPSITVMKPQKNVEYQAFLNDVAVSEKILVANDADELNLTIDYKLVGFGTHEVIVKANFNGNDAKTLDQTASISVDTLGIPVIANDSEVLITNLKEANHYQWYLDGKSIDGETKSTLLPVSSGNYQVEVSLNSCIKTSSGFEYLITGLEGSQSGVRAYPNPFDNSLTITLPGKITDKVTLYNVLGQPVHEVPVSTEMPTKVEMDLTSLPLGSYILGVGSYRLKVMKK